MNLEDLRRKAEKQSKKTDHATIWDQTQKTADHSISRPKRRLLVEKRHFLRTFNVFAAALEL